MKIVSYTDSRVRIMFDNLLEKNEFKTNIANLSGIKEVKEAGNSLTLIYEPKSQFAYFLKAFIKPSLEYKSKKMFEKLDKEDYHYYISLLIKNDLVKALWSISLLGFKRGFLTFTICTLGISRYLKNKF
ncbi:MAG: hypothetical protein ACP5JX_03585 [Sulfurihydrogenibium sp.]